MEEREGAEFIGKPPPEDLRKHPPVGSPIEHDESAAPGTASRESERRGEEMGHSRRDGEIHEEYGAPPSSPHAEEGGRHEGQTGETPSGAPGLRGGPGPGPAPGLAGTESVVLPPEGEETGHKGVVRLTEHDVRVKKHSK